MTAYGWCLSEQADVEISPDRRCITDGTSAIPPSWGSRHQQWVDGAWTPEKRRPEGYVYQTPAWARPSAPAPTPAGKKFQKAASVTGMKVVAERRIQTTDIECEWCHEIVVRRKIHGVRFCGQRCRQNAERARKRVPVAVRPCVGCGDMFEPYVPAQGGTPTRYCTLACRARTNRRREAERRERAS